MNVTPSFLYRMPEDLSEVDSALNTKLTVSREKTLQMKKGLSKQKNRLAAQKKELVSKTLLPPVELTAFLQSDETFFKVMEVAEHNEQDVLVRRYVCTIIICVQLS